MNNTSIRGLIASTCAVMCLAVVIPGAYALSVDVPEFDEDGQPLEPTPIEEFAPSSESDDVPGTDPLYDKGITVTQVEIEGNNLVSDDLILNTISSKPGSLYSKRRLQSDLKKLFDTGYFTEHLRVVPIATRDGVYLRFEVQENPVVQSIAIIDESVIEEDELKKLFEGQVGMPQNVNAINKAIQDIEQAYKDKGYILARVDDIREDNPGEVKLIINEGRINKIDYSGNKKTKSHVIRRAMSLKEGDVYNENTVSEDMKRIFSSQSFSDVRRVIKASADAPGEYDLTIEVDEKKTGAISLGGGVDTGTGVFGSVGYSDPNFRGMGHNVSTVFSMGTGVGVLGRDRDTIDRRVIQAQASWFNPSVAETLNSLGTSIYVRDLASFNVPLAIERRLGGTVTWSRPIESVPGVSVSTSVGYEDINLREGASRASLDRFGITPADRVEHLEDGSFAILAPEVFFDSRDNRLNPSQGWLSSFGTRMAMGFDVDSYGTLNTNIRRYLKVTDNITFALNAQAGGTAFGDIPTFNMFRMGGAYSIRGFQEGGVGVGEQYVLGSAEVRSKLPFLKSFQKFPLYDIVQAAIFVDAGKLFDEADTNEIFDRPGYGLAAGAGLRVNMPSLGPIRIDWANPIGNAGRNTRRFNFGVGQKF